MAVITNIDYEHLENYGGFAELQQAFVDFANKVPFYGAVVACADDAHLAAVLPKVSRRVITYGLSSPDAEITADEVALGPMSATARVRRRASIQGPATALGDITLQVPGRHNLLNALATVAVGLELEVPFPEIASGLREFKGAERRFEVRGEPNGILIVDDYGHHPTEIAAVLAAAQALRRRIIVVFQPHRYTRTKALLAEFGQAFRGAARVILTEIYSAGEEPIPGINADALATTIRSAIGIPVDVVLRLDDVPGAVTRVATQGDVVITLGAGSIGALPDRLIRALERTS